MVDAMIPTYTVFVRHAADCKDRNKGRDYKYCGCRKSIPGTCGTNSNLCNTGAALPLKGGAHYTANFSLPGRPERRQGRKANVKEGCLSGDRYRQLASVCSAMIVPEYPAVELATL
jgi:hypothetical protein